MKILSNEDFRQISSRVQENTIRISGRCFQTKKILGKKKHYQNKRLSNEDFRQIFSRFQENISDQMLFNEDFSHILSTDYYRTKIISVKHYQMKLSDKYYSTRIISAKYYQSSQLSDQRPSNEKNSFQTTNYRTT